MSCSSSDHNPDPIFQVLLESRSWIHQIVLNWTEYAGTNLCPNSTKMACIKTSHKHHHLVFVLMSGPGRRVWPVTWVLIRWRCKHLPLQYDIPAPFLTILLVPTAPLIKSSGWTHETVTKRIFSSFFHPGATRYKICINEPSLTKTEMAYPSFVLANVTGTTYVAANVPSNFL